ncbi:MAG: hypothetical protein ABSD68_04220 [Candidatus Micrarchaeales archaeon]|jgi:asparagine N-glycosylation enzyme membrane subunit Stt3
MYASRTKAEAVEPSTLPEEEDKNHFPLDFVRGNYRKYLLPLVIYLLIALIVFWPVTLNITTVVAASTGGSGLAGGDLFQNLWSLWWVDYAIFNLHISPYFTHLLFYPVGANLVTETLSPLAGLFSLPLQSVNLAFAFNFILFMDLTLSGFFMFLLADYVIKNKYGAFIAGAIFAFSPFHLSHTLAGQSNWIGIEFVPLFILFFLLMIRDKKIKILSVFGCAISMVLVTFFGDPEEGIVSLVCISLLLLIKLLSSEGREEILSKRFLISVLSVAVLALIIGSPFLIPIIYGIMHGALAMANAASSLVNNMVWSTPLLSFFLPSPVNNFFSTFSNSYYSIYAIDSVERIGYIGWVAICLILIAVFRDAKNRFRNAALWIILLAFFAWLSTGPYLQIGALPQQFDPRTSLPGVYLLYGKIPILNLIREPSRFNLIVTLCVAILAGFGFKEAITLMKNRPISNRKHFVQYFTLFITVLILTEYSGIPFSSIYIDSNFLTIPRPGVYDQIANIPGNFSVMVLPILTGATTRPYAYVGESMYFQTAFAKPILGGYATNACSRV